MTPADLHDRLEAATSDAPVARRNYLLGLWAGRELGLAGPDLALYVRDVMEADLEAPGEDDIVGKVAGDLAARGVPGAEALVRERLRLHHADAWRQAAMTD
jgi:hypothetical protein